MYGGLPGRAMGEAVRHDDLNRTAKAESEVDCAGQQREDSGERSTGELAIDLADPAAAAQAPWTGTPPVDAEALTRLISATSARIGVGRAGPRYRTNALLRFQ